MAVLAVLQSVLVAALTVVAFGFMAIQLRRLAALVATGAGSDENLTDAPAERFAKLVSLSFGHRKVLEDPGAGLLHAIFLFGFFVLGIGHLEVLLEGLTSYRVAFGHRPFDYARVLPDGLTNAYHLSQDLFAAAVVLAAAIALARRFVGRPERLLPRSIDGERILWFLVALYVTFFLLAGPSLLLRQRLGTAAGAWTQPVSAAIAGALSFVATPEARALRGVGFWAHMLRVPRVRGLPADDEAHAPGVRLAEPLLLPAQAVRPAAAHRLREDREVRDRTRPGAAVEESARHVRLHRVRPLQRRLPGARHRQAAHADEGAARRRSSTCGTVKTTARRASRDRSRRGPAP